MPIRSEYLANIVDMLQQLPQGAFLTVKSGEKINTMTIGWGSMGCIWNKPIMMVMVRYSRYTHELIKEAPDFSVSVPLDGHQKKALAGTGTTSGRDIDKFSVYDLSAKPAKSIESPVIDDCGLIYECRILYKHAMDPGLLDAALDNKFYKDHDYHVLYYGEIVNHYNNRV